MKAKRAFAAAMLCLLLIIPLRAMAEVPLEIREGVQDALDDAKLQEWDQMFSSLPNEVRTLWGGGDMSSFISGYALGENGFWGQTMQQGLTEIFKSMLPQILPTLLSLFAVALLSGFLRAMSEAGMSGLNDIAGLVCQCFAIGIALNEFLSLAVLARESIAKTTEFIELAFPALLTLLTAAGGIASAGIFQPAMAMLSSGVSVALQGVVLPVILTGGVMGVLNNITGRVQLGQFFNLSKTAAKWIIGFLFMLYFGVTSLQGMTAASFDGISIRTAKFALDKLVPIVGGMVSGTVDTMLGCAMLVKNAAGVTAILIAFGIVCMPLLRIAAGMLTFRFAAAVCEPVADPRLPKMLAALADILTYLFAAAVSLSVMFVITVGLIMSAGNVAVLGG
jgi:stage III sporulation protein AE